MPTVTKVFIRILILKLIFIHYPSHAKELVIALGNFAPMFAKEGEPALFKEIIDGVFNYLPDHRVSYRYMISNARLTVELNNHSVDGVANVFAKAEIKGCLTQPIFRFDDVAVTLKKHAHNINTIEALANKSIVSYQRAEHLLGEQFRQVAHASQYYQELARPEEQAKLLATELVDVSVGDKYIFLHSLKLWQKENYQPNSVVFHPIFPPVYSRMGFNDQALCDEFNQAFQQFKASGQYENTYQNFLKKLGYIAQQP